MASATQEALQAAVSGLLYPSETDSPIEVVSWNWRESVLAPDDVRRLAGKEKDASVEEVSPEEFFADLTEEQDWHDDEDKETVKRFRVLLAVLKECLTGLRVLKVGETEIDIFVVGRTSDGNWEGITTQAVET